MPSAKLATVTLEGTHVKLVPLRLDHVEHLTNIGLDQSLWQFTSIRIQSPAEMQAYVERALNDQLLGPALPFVIVDRRTNEIIGSTRYHSFSELHSRIEIGFTWISPAWQRTVINTESKYLLLKHAFEILECARVEFKVDSSNVKSRRALERIGAKREGVLRSYVLSSHRGPRDVVSYSIISNEWPAEKLKLEQMMVPNDRTASDPEKGYDLVAAEYADHFGDELRHKPFDQKMLELLIEKCQPNSIICDMGCGPAQVARFLKSRGARVCGYDISPAMIAHAHTLDPDLTLERHSMLDLSAIPDSSLGGIAAFYSVIHVPKTDVVTVLSQFKRILAPHGTLLITFHIGSETVHRDEWWGHSVNIDFHFFETDEMKQNLIDAGFILDELIERGPYPSEYPSRRAYFLAHRE